MLPELTGASPEVFTRVVGGRAAWMNLAERGVIRVSGADRVRFLNGMLTNDLSALAPGRIDYGLLLDRKGRIQSDLFVLVLEEAFLLDTAAGTGPRVAEQLERYVVADDVRVEDCVGRLGRIAVEGPAARDRLAALGVALPEPDRVLGVSWRGSSLLCVGRGHVSRGGIGILAAEPALRELVAGLDLPPLSPDHAEVLRLESFLPRYGVDVTDRNLPAEGRLEHAVSWTKGCYVGQEIVARVRSRGRVNRLLVGIRAEGRVEPGDPISVDGATQGEVTSAVMSPVSGSLAFGYVRTESARPGTGLRIGATRGTVAWPSLEEASGSERR